MRCPIITRLPYRAKVALLDAIIHDWSSGIIPENWKRSLVVSIPKNGVTSGDPQKYHPLSLTSCVSKITKQLSHLVIKLKKNNTCLSRIVCVWVYQGSLTVQLISLSYICLDIPDRHDHRQPKEKK